MKRIKQAVILAGGQGTRLKPFTNEHPKPMYAFNGKPFIEYLIEQVKSFGIEEVVLLLGYRADEIEAYLGDGKKYEMRIIYHITPVVYDTGNRVAAAMDLLNEDFLLMYCDNYCPIDFQKLEYDYNMNNAEVQITGYLNEDGYTKDNLMTSSDGRVLVYDKKRITQGLKGVDIGYALINKEAIQYIKDMEGTFNFEEVVYPRCISKQKLCVTLTKHRYYSIGSWQRIELTKRFFNNMKTVFLDRDGTINRKPPKACYVEKKEDFVWLEGAKEAILRLKQNNYRVILVSNQPGIARGNLNEETLAEIHDKMQSELKQEMGTTIDAIYYCPHNWDEGCNCRKPKPGMLYQAQKDYSLDLTKCILIGDDERDVEAGNQAGCVCYQVTEEKSLLDIVNDILD